MGYIKKFIESSELNEIYIFREKSIYLDTADKLNWQITINILVIFILILANVKDLLNRIITCAVPIYFSDNQQEYADEICYISEKYHVYDEDMILVNGQNSSLVYADRMLKKLDYRNYQSAHRFESYYIWVPYVLAVQIVLLVALKSVWQYSLKKIISLDVNELLSASISCKDVQLDKFLHDHSSSLGINEHYFQNVHFNYLFVNLSKFLFVRSLEPKRSFLDENILSLAYLSVKAINILIIFVELLLMRKLLGVEFGSFLYEKFSGTGSLRNESMYFPLKSVCLFRIRELTNVNSYAVVCSLPINLFIQYMFLFLFVWYTMLVGLNVYSLVKWSMQIRRSCQIGYVQSGLVSALQQVNTNRNKQSCSSRLHHLNAGIECVKCSQAFGLFYDRLFYSDFIFLLKIISNNGNRSLVDTLLAYFWYLSINSPKIKYEKTTLTNY